MNQTSLQLTTIAQNWLDRDPDERTRSELAKLIASQDYTELADRFSQRLEFGTAGLRGVVGAGPNRMNRFVIQQTALGLGRYLLATIEGAAERGVVIGYDGRPDSRSFAQDTASVLMAQGIKVYLTYKVAATPITAFGVKQLNACAAVVVTASHNPPQYNGFKVYWENGAQIIPPHDKGIAAQIDRAATETIGLLPLPQAEEQGLLVWLTESYYEQYQRAVISEPLLLDEHSMHELPIAYTAMHGVGAEMARKLLTAKGFSQVYSVAEQEQPDGTFPTVTFPNPEEPGAMDMVMATASQHQAQLALANDPDADRFAAALYTGEPGQYQRLTGDQVGALLADHLLRQQPDSLVGNTIVSSMMLEHIAEHYGASYYQTLTGFKWLTNVAMDLQTESRPFLFAYEEALGYTIGTNVWDKDGLSAMVAFCQMAAQLHEQGLTVWDRLAEIYHRHGCYYTAQVSIALSDDTPNIGEFLRANPPTEINGQSILSCWDFKTGEILHADESRQPLDYPSSDVLVYYLADRSRVIIRPSGTEPKIKCYYEVVVDTMEDEQYFEMELRAKRAMETFIAAHQSSLPLR
uniref:phospho-sugar mutase n=1 Tax=Thaumasiovibrio occultus TaxID=1891184 RepID=UPI000B35E6ED|nr:phospho-sugar mutase [Thaumasiovibrio occultus]